MEIFRSKDADQDLRESSAGVYRGGGPHGVCESHTA